MCICTYKRPELLARLLGELQNQVTDKLFSYSIVVVDNDYTQSGKSVVEACKKNSLVTIDYSEEPEQNISLARNKAVKQATGNFIAFIDDDEYPTEKWLVTLYKALIEFNADGVLGPVSPHFEIEPPRWILKSKLCERKSFQTGSIIRNQKYTRTGNVLVTKSIFDENERPFNPLFGRTGGEDSAFFKKNIAKGYIFVWCNEAFVYETVPEERFRRSYFLKRAFIRGAGEVKLRSISIYEIFKSIIAIVLYTSALPVFFIIRHHLFMRYLVKNCDHIGKILAVFGIEIIKERNF